MNFLSKLLNNLVHSENIAYTAVRSTISAQVCGWLDFATAFAMFRWVGLAPIYATLVGAVVGGLSNCVINYKFTYPTQACAFNVVIVKFLMVWLSSVSLNAFGTQLLYVALCHWEWLATIGFKPGGYFTAARLTMALLVSVFWIFLLQKNFVYKPVAFDKYAAKIAAFLCLPSLPHKEKNL